MLRHAGRFLRQARQAPLAEPYASHRRRFCTAATSVGSMVGTQLKRDDNTDIGTMHRLY